MPMTTEQRRRVRRSTLLLVLFAFLVYGAFIAYSVTTHG
jgi:hypothetical protein